MQIAVRHNLQVYDPADASLREDSAHVLPVRDAQAVMGETVAAYLARVEWHFDLPTVCRINGEFYGRAEWETRALAVNDNVEFVSRPLGSGSGGTGKTIMSIVALVALSAVAGPAGAALSGAFGLTGFAASAVTAAASAVIVGAGSLALSYFLKPKSGGKSGSTDALYSFGLQGNQARPMQPIPVLNGRLKFAPDYAAPTYSEYSGDGMIDYALFAVTCGRWRPEQVLIGDTPIWHYQNGYNPDYPGVELQFVEPGNQVTLYPVNVVTADELSGSELSTTYTPGYIVNAAGTQAKELLLDFVWPGGAYHTSEKGKSIRADTHIVVRVRTVDDAGAPKGQWVEVFGKVYSNNKQSQIRVTERIPVSPDRYEVSVRRFNAPTAEGNGTDAVTWTALRAHIEGPQAFPRVSVMAVKGVASKELSGISGGQLRVIGTRILPVWRDGLFVEEPTRSIAWAALDWWRNGDYAAGLSISDTDFQAFVRYDALWSALGHTFDRRTTEAQTLDDVLETVLKAGRAFPSPVGDKITITRDEPRGLPRMLFTENDIVRDSLEINYALSDQAWSDGIVGEYLDETTWRLAEVSSAPDGVRLLNPARVQIEGIVNRKQAAGVVRFMAAESQYRRITVAWTARMEGRLLKRGDLVKLAADEPETWAQSCECLSLGKDGVTLTLDPPPVWEPGNRHYIEIRRRDARPWGPHRVVRGSNAATVIVDPEGDLAGLADALARTDTQEAPWVAFSPGQPRTFPVLITDGDPDQDGEHIHLTGAIDAGEVYTTTENGVPPLLQIPDLFSSGMPVILGLSARATQRQLTILLTAGWQPAKNAASYVADISYDAGNEWIRAYEGDRTTFEAIVGGSDQMRVRVAGVTPGGARGAFYVVEVTVPDLVVSNENVGLIAIDYVDLVQDVRSRIDHILEVEAEANAKARDLLARVLSAAAVGDQNVAAIYREEQSRLSADAGLASDISAVVVRVGGAETAVITEREARVDGDVAQARRTDALITQTNNDRAYFLNEQQTRIDNDGVLSSQITALGVQSGNDRAYFLSEQQTRISNDAAYASDLFALQARVGTSEASLIEERTARSTADTAFAQSLTDVYARTDAGTAVGRFSLVAQSGPAGVSARIQALVAVQAGGQTRGAGYYVEVMDDGTSRFVVDASAFYITANGQSAPTFSFDGETLTIPRLRVTQQAILPGAVVDPVIKDVVNYTIPSVTGDTWTELPGSEIYFNVDNPNGYAVTATVMTDLYVQLTNNSTTIMIAEVLTAIAINGNAWNNAPTNSARISAGNQPSQGFQPSGSATSGGAIASTMMVVVGPGMNRLSIVYKFRAPNTGAGARINLGRIYTLIAKR